MGPWLHFRMYVRPMPTLAAAIRVGTWRAVDVDRAEASTAGAVAAMAAVEPKRTSSV